MDAAVPELGSGNKPADSPLRGAADTIPVEKESLGQGAMEKCRCPQTYSTTSIVLLEKPILLQSPRKRAAEILIFGTKNRYSCIRPWELVIL